MDSLALHAWLFFAMFSLMLLLPNNKRSPSNIRLKLGRILAGTALIAALFSQLAPVDFLRLLLGALTVILAMSIKQKPLRRSSTSSSVDHSGGSTALILGIFLLYLLSVLSRIINTDTNLRITSLSFIMIAASTVATSVLFVTILKLKKHLFRPVDDNTPWPTVSLLIPARNETHALASSLQSALASDYPKLEIIVYDDCSQDNTATIIKSFAHDGVRFVQGEEVSESWLGKNRAYKTLLAQASGELVIFSSVDIHYSKYSISQLVTTLNANNLDMLSVMPYRREFDFLASILQPMRHLRTIIQSNPSVSSLWLVRQKYVTDQGGFEAVRSSVYPEKHFLKQANYQFIISNIELGVSTRKRFSSQLDTATRTLFPLLRRSVPLLFLSVFSLLLFMLLPYVLLAMDIAGFEVNLLASWLIWPAIIMYTAAQALLLFKLQPNSWWLAPLSFPLSVVAELYGLVSSLSSYLGSRALWKGRNICLPKKNTIKKPKNSSSRKITNNT